MTLLLLLGMLTGWVVLRLFGVTEISMTQAAAKRDNQTTNS